MPQDTLEEALADLTKEEIAELHTGKPGKVVSYDASTQTADVDIQIRRAQVADEDPESEVEFVLYPRLPKVRVMNLAWGAWTLTAPLSAGDPVFVQILDADPSAYLRTGDLSNPESLARHHLSFAVCWPALRPDPSAISTAHSDRLVLGKDGDKPRLELTEAGSVYVYSDDIRLVDNTASEGIPLGDSLKSWLDGHTHSAGGLTAPSGGGSVTGSSGGPISTSPSPSANAKVK